MKSVVFKSIRSFIGANDFKESREFYLELGFEEIQLSSTLSYFAISNDIGFYLQNAYVKDWVDNTMLFLEVENLEEYLAELKLKNLIKKFPKVRISEIVHNHWGKVLFVHDPSGILWQIGNFKN